MTTNNINQRIIRFSLFLLIALAAMSACSDEPKEKIENKVTTADFLKERFEASEHIRSSEVKTYVGQDLYELINGGAEVYHLYQFIEVVNAYYTLGEIEVTADIYQFASSDLAYGLFSTLRPIESESAGLGVESFQSSTSVLFVKGKYIVRVTGFEDSDISANAVLTLALAIEPTIAGTTELPKLFKSLPTEHRTPNSNKIIAVDFLGRKGLTNVYTADYDIDGAEFLYFITDDISGGKFINLKSQIESEPGSQTNLPNLPFDKDYSLKSKSSYYGDIVVGLKNSKLCGMTGYDDSRIDMLSDWLNSIK